MGTNEANPEWWGWWRLDGGDGILVYYITVVINYKTDAKMTFDVL